MEDQKCTDSPLSPPPVLDLPGGEPCPVLYEDTGCLAIDKPPGWRCLDGPLDPSGPDLQTALDQAIAAGAPWAAARHLRRLRVVFPLDAESSGIVLLARDAAEAAYRRALDDRRTGRDYLAVVGGKPPRRTWRCCLKISLDPARPGRVATHPSRGQYADTEFHVLGHGDGMALIHARPRTSRPHQIRAHLAASGLPILGDALYGFGRNLPRRGQRDRIVERTAPTAPELAARRTRTQQLGLALRAVGLSFLCPHREEILSLEAPVVDFLARYGFEAIVPEPLDDEAFETAAEPEADTDASTDTDAAREAVDPAENRPDPRDS